MRNRDREVFRKLTRLLRHFRRADKRFRKVALPVKTWERVWKIPVSTKAELAPYGRAIPIRQAYNLTATSGTTSSSQIIAHSRDCYETHLARLVEQYRSIGLSSKDLCLNLCAYSLNSGGRLMEQAYKAAGLGVIPMGILDTPEKTTEVARLVGLLKPTVVNSYTNQLFDLFSLLGKKHSIRACVVNGEPLLPSFKMQIERMGGVKVFNHYGAMEFSGFAIAQKHTDEDMKIFGRGLLIEVQREDGTFAQTGRGALVVTDLENLSMPFIRYRLGDRVELCRKSSGLYIKVLGRLSDSLLVDGEIYSCDEVVRVVQGVIGHPHFLVLIEKDGKTYKDRVVVNLPPSDEPRGLKVLRVVESAFHWEGLITVRSYRGSFPKTSTGKFRHLMDARKNA
jgi:phenylacetate-coenzyme A ligase PaaK-like adenylate-forming protein